MRSVIPIQTFIATDTAGTDYRLKVFQEYEEIIDVRTMAVGCLQIPTLKSIETEEGDRVRYVAKGRYSFLDRRSGTRVDLKSDDPEAP